MGIRRWAVAIATSLTLLLSGCGNPTNQEYAAKANAVCNDIATKQPEIFPSGPVPRDPAGSEAYFVKSAEAWKGLVARLKTLDRPSDYAQPLAALYEQMDKFSAVKEQGIGAVKARRAISMDEITYGQTLITDISDRMHAMGMTDCPYGAAKRGEHRGRHRTAHRRAQANVHRPVPGHARRPARA
jgi:hypothetical protein